MKCQIKGRLIPKTKICLHCGKEFRPKQAVQKYCSAKCRVAHEREKLRTSGEVVAPVMLKPARRKCLKCGKEFEEHFKGDKFCSDECCLQYYRPEVKEAFVNVFSGCFKWKRGD